LAATLRKLRNAQLIPLLLQELDRMLDASDFRIILHLVAQATHALARLLLVVIRHAQRVCAWCARASVGRRVS
jgi:hypothetical protein